MQSLTAFVDNVHWVPCSAMKTAINSQSGLEEIQPLATWSEVPLLLAFDEIARWQGRK
jgi:hypothetical protein